MAKKGALYLIPTTLGESSIDFSIPKEAQEKIISLRFFIVENVKSARQYLRTIDSQFPIDDCTFEELNKHTNPEDIASFLNPIFDGNDVGIISEAGCPGIADPGADVVSIAHEKNIHVIPFVGPSSMFMALMSSGMNGQNFAFHGYLPKEKSERIKTLKRLENSAKYGAQLFMETPFRNNHLLEDVLENCNNTLKLCIACDITLSSELIKTKTIAEWKTSKPDLNKRPCVFILGF
ncbi:MAG: SAM-dependent methyltransferase [Bacteroidia bacterium]